MPQGIWGPQFYGELPVINGAIYPHLEVEPRPYRFRVLNSSNARVYHLFLNLAQLATDVPDLVPFHQIGSDGGLLPAPVRLTKSLLGPAERADIIIDFKGFEGETVTLSNDAVSPYPGWGALLQNAPAPLSELMQFRVTRPLSSKSSGSTAYSLPGPIAFPPLKPQAAVKTRDFILSETMDPSGLSMGMRINGMGYDDPLTESIELGALERWRFINMTEDAHAMHLHLVQFRVVERQGFDPIAMQRGRLVLVGEPRLAEPPEQGWKDTACVNPRDMLTILAKFEGFTGRYVFHCHTLEHEDNDMMRPFEVVPVGAAQEKS
jgi:spore coat protein A